MKNTLLPFALLILLSCNASTKQKKGKESGKEIGIEASAITSGTSFTTIAKLPKKLKEVSGIKADGAYLWAICDNPQSPVYKLLLSGEPVQELRLGNIPVSDVEDVTTDADYLYIADVGDNDGKRQERQVIKIKKASLGTEKEVQAQGEIIRFSFPASGGGKKKDNDYDCEAILSYGNALYLFTKRRGDDKTELFMLSKTPGEQVPKSIALFDSQGLITGAALNESGTEVVLTGYQKGHRQPFLLLLTGFGNNNFFSGQQRRLALAAGTEDWQVESITFKDARSLLFACEATPDHPATLYGIDKDRIK